MIRPYDVLSLKCKLIILYINSNIVDVKLHSYRIDRARRKTKFSGLYEICSTPINSFLLVVYVKSCKVLRWLKFTV